MFNMSTGEEGVQFLPINQQKFENSSNHKQKDEDGSFGFHEVAASKNSPSIFSKMSATTGRTYCVICAILLLIILVLVITLASKRCENFNLGAAAAFNTSNLSSVDLVKAELHKDVEGNEFPWQSLRLPTSISPATYKLFLWPNLSDKNFTGNVSIVALCKHATDFILLNAKQLIIGMVTVKGTKSGYFVIGSVKESRTLECLHIKLNKMCSTMEELTLNIEFAGPIAEGLLEGFYLSEYKKADKLKRLGTTHMEPTSARRAFPCFDEPLFKANFTLSMKRDKDHKTLFNMPIRQTHKLDDVYLLDEYDWSVKMSSYLVAYMILPNDYVSIGSETTSGTKVNVWAPSAMIDSGHFAVEVAVVVLQFFEEFFGVPYPLPKLDMIGIPDFAAGAMENWGLVTYRMVTLMYDNKTTAEQLKQSVAEVVTHELAHQWFGNIVTMEWWDDLWLNEGFATFTQAIGVSIFRKDWDMFSQFYLMNFRMALETDMMIHSHPVKVDVNNVHEIDSIFDDISYFKGSSLIRMLEDVVGRKALQEGLRIYLARFAFRNAESTDLWRAFSEGLIKVANDTLPEDSPARNLPRVMNTWIRQMNYPLVSVQLRGSRMRLSQERFLAYPNSTKIWKQAYESPYGYRWCIPVKYITSEQSTPKWAWLDMVEETWVDLDHSPTWVKINFDQTGFYRVNYEEEMWHKLTEVVVSNLPPLSTTDRAGLLNDAFVLAKAGLSDIRIALNMSLVLAKEPSFVLWKTAFYHLKNMAYMLYDNTKISKSVERFVGDLLKPHLQNPKFAWDNNDLGHLDMISRTALYLIAVHFNQRDVLTHAKGVFQKFLNDSKTPINPNMLSVVYLSGIMEGTKNDWLRILRRLELHLTPAERRIIRSALATTKDSTLLYSLLQWSVKPGKIRDQDIIALLIEIANNPIGRDLVWTFLQRNWQFFAQKYGSQAFLMSELVEVCKGFSTEYDFNRVKKFVETEDLGSGKRAAQRSLEKIRSNVLWQHHNSKNCAAWLESNASRITNV